ncbi:hypothetical protein [Vibrio phage JSF23]|jgi:hypothetical protein|uniref:Uncharacterized protein n=4 Tax=Icepovirus bengalense TaxID=2846603 RepID=A0A076G6G7_9CAUD|nr:hypothetical protein ViPhICP2p48 [Vibrio phage ICP2]ADX87797.1 hypothetical protein TU12-16_00215 [Vibrio phage ICP2_2006_A]AII27092.1 hypothetical protein ICP22011A_0048 [Vibrio phage ICP2_2011_A]ASV43745.1 hypothetical protein [Vibrio phage JSF23]ASV43841.1 hypothetical protein [Vibrio phage JSF27]ADX87730.1 hypothetical protein [Vibrio phage ICP2]
MGEEIKVGDWVRYITSGGPDLTHNKEYQIIQVYSSDATYGMIRVLDDVGDVHDLMDFEYEWLGTRNPDWILVFQKGDTSPNGGEWASLTVFDNETQWYCFRNIEGELRFVSDSPATKEPLDAVRAAAMLLVFADEEAKL